MLTINHRRQDSVEIIELDGILNADTSPNLEDILEPLAESETSLVLLHIPKLSFINSAGIGCFIGVIQRIRSKGGDIRFANVAPKVKRAFRLLDMDEFFQFFDDMETGLNSYR